MLVLINFTPVLYLFSEHKVSIEHTVLGHHFSCMFDSLQQTDHRDKTGPCLEYVLQHKILDTLATLARTDVSVATTQTHFMYDILNLLQDNVYT